MKLVKLKNGFRLNGSDSELEALVFATQFGSDAIADKKKHESLSSAAKGAIRRERFKQPGGPLATFDVDRRESATED